MCEAVGSKRAPLLVKLDSKKLAIDWALSFLGCMRYLVKKPCIVLDIDGTVLINNYDDETKSKKCVVGFKELVDACSDHQITVFCITARCEDEDTRKYTTRQLNKCQIGPIEHIYLRPEDAEYSTYKYNARRDIEKKGYSILLTIGDQFADISKEEMPKELDDNGIYAGQLADGMQFGIKLPSEYSQ